MVQTAELRAFNDLAPTQYRSLKWALLVESQSRPRRVVVGKYEVSVFLRWRALKITKWLRPSLRIAPIRRSAYGFCELKPRQRPPTIKAALERSLHIRT
jgi:hypothetical protein